MDQLDKFSEKQIAEISKLQAVSNDLKLVAEKAEVKDDETLKNANVIIKQINAHKKLVKDEREALTKPLNNVVKQLIAKEKEVLLPLDEGKTELSGKIIAYSEEVERKRKAEEERVAKIVETLEAYFSNAITLVDQVDARGREMKSYFATLSDADQTTPAIKIALLNTVEKLTLRKDSILEEERLAAERKRQEEEAARLAEEAKAQSAEEAKLAAERKANEDETLIALAVM